MVTDNELTALRSYIGRFIELSDADWQMLVPHLSNMNLKKHDDFEKEGTIGRKLAYVVHGTMRHYYTVNGEEKTTYFYFENAMLGSYFSCITGQPSLVTFEALTDTRLIVFPYAALKTLFDKSKAWERFGRLLAEYLAMGLEERMVGLLTLSPEERYMQLLNSNKQKILERIPQHYIANYLGITPVSLSRIRNRMLVHK